MRACVFVCLYVYVSLHLSLSLRLSASLCCVTFFEPGRIKVDFKFNFKLSLLGLKTGGEALHRTIMLQRLLRDS